MDSDPEIEKPCRIKDPEEYEEAAGTVEAEK